jgi:hypothetical protein
VYEVRGQRHLAAAALLLASVWPSGLTQAQVPDDDTWMPTFGSRPIDKLPKSGYAEPEDYRAWNEPDPPTDYELLCHPKGLFRVGEAGVERLCIIEARRPEDEVGPVSLALHAADGSVRWRAEADWLGTNQRMRPYWLPISVEGTQRLRLAREARTRADVPIALADEAPAVKLDLVAPREPLAVDLGLALLPDSELVAKRGTRIDLRVGVAEGVGLPVVVELAVESRTGVAAYTDSLEIDAGRAGRTGQMTIDTARLPASDASISVKATAEADVLAEERYLLRLVDRAPDPSFGAEYMRLRYTQPVRDGDEERTWDEIWDNSDLRDVVVRFPGQPYRMVFWRGANYVACWALPEAWLTYEWLEAEPDFYGAVGCVEPLQDKDCRYSRVEIVNSTPARAVVSWKYALTDLEVKIIRDERAEEIFTLYPDGVGTRTMRAFYESGWHENQEFILVNRPGRWPSMALDPQAITFLSPDGERQAPVWPKPGFELYGWPQVISIVNLGRGPRPFMVTPDAPTQAKVWADPYVDKPDLFNSYPHWPVTRGMRTSWLDDPADFQRPTHSNLANLVNSPIEQTDREKRFLWLIGMGRSEQEILDISRCWLKPGEVVPGHNLRSKGYSQVERAYILSVDGPRAPQECQFTLVPDPDTPVINPAFIIEGWSGPARVSVEGADEVHVGRERDDEVGERLVVWVRGRSAGPGAVVLEPQ